jgi:transposase
MVELPFCKAILPIYKDEIDKNANKKLWKTMTCLKCQQCINRDTNAVLNLLYICRRKDLYIEQLQKKTIYVENSCL